MYSYQHKYISQSPPVNSLEPWSINKTIKLLMNEVVDRYTDHPTPFLYLVDSEPYCFAPWVDVTRAPMGFDRQSIPSLKRTLLRTKSDVQVAQALCSLNDLVKNPEKACEALRLNIMQALVRLMHSKNMYIRIKTLDVLEVLASAPKGRVTLTQNKYIMEHLKKNMEDPELLVRAQAFRTLRSLAINWFAVKYLVEEHFVRHILTALQTAMKSSVSMAEHLYYLLETLEHLLDFNDAVKLESIRYDIFDITSLLTHQNSKVRGAAMGVFTQLCKHKLGREGCVAHGVVDQLIPSSYKEDEQLQAKVFGTLMFTTALIKGKIDSVEKDIHHDALNVLINDNSALHLKRNAAKVLMNLIKMPTVCKEMQPHLKDIVNIDTANDTVLQHQLNEIIEHLTEE